MLSVADMVKNGQVVTFSHFHDDNLWYVTESGFKFPVPTSEAGNATFLAQDKAIMFMRYIRKQVELVKEAVEAA